MLLVTPPAPTMNWARLATSCPRPLSEMVAVLGNTRPTAEYPEYVASVTPASTMPEFQSILFWYSRMLNKPDPKIKVLRRDNRPSFGVVAAIVVTPGLSGRC